MNNIKSLEYVNIKLSSFKQNGKTTPLYIVTNYDSCLPNENQDNIIFLNFTLLNDYPQLDDNNDNGLNNFYKFQQQNPIITFCSKNIVTNVINNINRILDFDLVVNDDGVPKINTLSNEYTQPKLVFDPLTDCGSLKQTSCALKLKKKKDERSCTSQESHDTIGRQAKRCGNTEFKQKFGETGYKISNHACGKFEMCGLGKDVGYRYYFCKYKDSIGFKLLTVTAISNTWNRYLKKGILEPETATFIGNLLG